MTGYQGSRRLANAKPTRPLSQKFWTLHVGAIDRNVGFWSRSSQKVHVSAALLVRSQEESRGKVQVQVEAQLGQKRRDFVPWPLPQPVLWPACFVLSPECYLTKFPLVQCVLMLELRRRLGPLYAPGNTNADAIGPALTSSLCQELPFPPPSPIPQAWLFEQFRKSSFRILWFCECLLISVPVPFHGSSEFKNLSNECQRKVPRSNAVLGGAN